MWKILVAAQNQDLNGTLAGILESEPFDIVVVGSGNEVQASAAAEHPALILLDMEISGVDAISICQDIRSSGEIFHTPIIALTAEHEAAVKVRTLNAGADDCLTKPFDRRELVARIKAVLRRTALPAQINTLRAGPIEMDIDRWSLWVDGKPIELTTKEFHLLRELLQAKGRVMPREALLQRVWGHPSAQRIDTRTVDVHVGRLRRKLGHPGRYIITVRNVGYRLDIFLDWATKGTRAHRE